MTPSFDHTMGNRNGQYAYLDASYMSGGIETILQSSTFDGSSQDCYLR